jgi:peptide/nickel transport system permease protein
LAESLVLKGSPWYSPQKVILILSEVRRYPVLPTLVILLLLIVPAVGANWIAPHDPFDGDLNVRLLPPAWVGEETNVRTVVDRVTDRNNQFTPGEATRQIQSGKAMLIAASGENPDRAIVVGDELLEVKQAGGSGKYLLGTDKVGRDVLSRIIHGSRISVIVAGIAIFISGAIGATLGITAGYFGGWVDSLLMRLVDISLSIPIILMALVLVTALGASYETIVTVLVIFLWAQYARQARGETLTVRVQDFIARARVAGASDARIMLKHIFPNVFNSMVVLATLQVGFVIILEASLSFLGAGIPRPNPAWGLMVADGRELIISSWWVSLFPGVAIMLVVMAMNLLGDWLRDRLDPKQRQV